MNRAQHKTEAESILRKVKKTRKKMDGQMVHPNVAIQLQMATQSDIAVAQVHATLAQLED